MRKSVHKCNLCGHDNFKSADWTNTKWAKRPAETISKSDLALEQSPKQRLHTVAKPPLEEQMPWKTCQHGWWMSTFGSKNFRSGVNEWIPQCTKLSFMQRGPTLQEKWDWLDGGSFWMSQPVEWAWRQLFLVDLPPKKVPFINRGHTDNGERQNEEGDHQHRLACPLIVLTFAPDLVKEHVFSLRCWRMTACASRVKSLPCLLLLATNVMWMVHLLWRFQCWQQEEKHHHWQNIALKKHLKDLPDRGYADAAEQHMGLNTERAAHPWWQLWRQQTCLAKPMSEEMEKKMFLSGDWANMQWHWRCAAPSKH